MRNSLWSDVKGDEPKSDSNAKPLTVETVDNHVYYYARVDGDRTLALMKTIRELDAKLRTERLTTASREHTDDSDMVAHSVLRWRPT